MKISQQGVVTVKFKFIWAFTVAVFLVFRAGTVAYGSELSVNFGYDVSLTDFNLDILSLTGLKANIITPSRLYLLEINYDFNANFSLKAGLDWGTVNLGEIELIEPGISIEDSLSQNNIIWDLEGKAQLPLSKKIILAGFTGYTGLKTTNVNVVKIISANQITMELGQSINSAYVGAALTLMMKRWELGTSYQVMINPDGYLQVAIYNNDPLLAGETNVIGLNGLSNSFFTIYLQTGFGKKWVINTGYQVTNTNYSISGINMIWNTKSIWLKLLYHL